MNIQPILNDIKAAGGTSYYVGGCVRDSLLGITPKDWDIEVFGVTQAALENILGKHGEVDMVGKSFGVYKFGPYDISLPRRERKTGHSHKDFECEVDPFMSLEEAASRRDFTINSMMMDTETAEVIDSFEGKHDLTHKWLSHTSPRFAEDPLRVLRGMQFCGRFNMKATNELLCWCQELTVMYYTIPVERIWEEWKKWALKSTKPSAGLKFLEQSSWINHYPELKALIGLEQDPEYHPEICTFKHTFMVCDAVADIATRENLCDDKRLILMLSALCHDLGKATTTCINKKGRIASPGHAQETQLTTSFLLRIGCPYDIIDKIKPLVFCHMDHLNWKSTKNKEKFVGKLAQRLTKKASINMLELLVEADVSGRSPLPKGKSSDMVEIRAMAISMGCSEAPLEPIIKGDHLIELGFKPGPKFKEILDTCYAIQLSTQFSSVLEGIKRCNLKNQK